MKLGDRVVYDPIESNEFWEDRIGKIGTVTSPGWTDVDSEGSIGVTFDDEDSECFPLTKNLKILQK